MTQHSVSADNPGLVGSSWLSTQWETARALSQQAGACILVLGIGGLPLQSWFEGERCGK